MQTRRHHILILGGTKEARLLAEALAQEPGLSVTYALHAHYLEITRWDR